jgi:hypothetical protein
LFRYFSIEIYIFPFLANYILTWFVWWRLDKKENVGYFLAVWAGCYPQSRAVAAVKLIWAEPAKGMEKKRKIEREISEMEVFVESVATVLVMTVIMMTTLGLGPEGNKQREEIIGGYYSADQYLFFFSLATSILSASLGLAKSLKTGPCKILQDGGAAGGFLTGRFLLLLLSCGATLVSKGLALDSQHASLND